MVSTLGGSPPRLIARRARQWPSERKQKTANGRSARVKMGSTAPEMAFYGGTDMDRGRCAILKMAAQITIVGTRLVDTIVLEGMGLPIAGVDSRSKSPTDPTALAVRQ